MVKFRTSTSEAPKPESVVLMFRDLNRDPSVKYLWSHQDKILEGYYQSHLQKKDKEQLLSKKLRDLPQVN